LSGGPAPAVQVRQVTSAGIELADGLVLPGPSIFLDGNVFLWNTPTHPAGDAKWTGWSKVHFEVFEVVVPKPEILILGTGKRVLHPPAHIRAYLNGLGIQLDVMDTWNACTTYNLLAEEGRTVAAALLPMSSGSWKQQA